jgi:hypothetical protein
MFTEMNSKQVENHTRQRFGGERFRIIEGNSLKTVPAY